MAENLRNANVAPPTVPVVTPSGAIKHVIYGKGINGMVKLDSGEPDIAKAYEKQGFVLLADLYTREDKPDHYAEYMRFHAEALAGRVDPTSFPAELLPEEVRKRRGKPQVATERPKFEPRVAVAPAAAAEKKGR